jgi:hypothetical protein
VDNDVALQYDLYRQEEELMNILNDADQAVSGLLLRHRNINGMLADEAAEEGLFEIRNYRGTARDHALETCRSVASIRFAAMSAMAEYLDRDQRVDVLGI